MILQAPRHQLLAPQEGVEDDHLGRRIVMMIMMMMMVMMTMTMITMMLTMLELSH